MLYCDLRLLCCGVFEDVVRDVVFGEGLGCDAEFGFGEGEE